MQEPQSNLEESQTQHLKSWFFLKNRPIHNVLQRNLEEQAQPGSAFLEHLEAQGLKISTNHAGRKEEGELQHVTGLPFSHQ